MPLDLDFIAGVVEFFGDLGLEWLFDKGNRRTPWMAVLVLLFTSGAVCGVVFFRDSMESWQVWLVAAAAVLFAAFAAIDLWNWRDLRRRNARIQQETSR